jgi:hypothetical protein
MDKTHTVHKFYGRLLYLSEITERTGMPEGTVRSKRHRGEMPCVWRGPGGRLVAWEKQLNQWFQEYLAERQEKTSKTKEVTEQ